MEDGVPGEDRDAKVAKPAATTGQRTGLKTGHYNFKRDERVATWLDKQTEGRFVGATLFGII